LRLKIGCKTCIETHAIPLGVIECSVACDQEDTFCLAIQP